MVLQSLQPQASFLLSFLRPKCCFHSYGMFPCSGIFRRERGPRGRCGWLHSLEMPCGEDLRCALFVHILHILIAPLDIHGSFHGKSVRFRVQFQAGSTGGKNSFSGPGTPNLSVGSYTPMPSPMLSPLIAGTPSGCTMTLVQERGARSTLEVVSQSLQQKWK